VTTFTFKKWAENDQKWAENVIFSIFAHPKTVLTLKISSFAHFSSPAKNKKWAGIEVIFPLSCSKYSRALAHIVPYFCKK
jgi:hypothetical protein